MRSLISGSGSYGMHIWSRNESLAVGMAGVMVDDNVTTSRPLCPHQGWDRQVRQEQTPPARMAVWKDGCQLMGYSSCVYEIRKANVPHLQKMGFDDEVWMRKRIKWQKIIGVMKRQQAPPVGDGGVYFSLRLNPWSSSSAGKKFAMFSDKDWTCYMYI